MKENGILETWSNHRACCGMFKVKSSLETWELEFSHGLTLALSPIAVVNLILILTLLSFSLTKTLILIALCTNILNKWRILNEIKIYWKGKVVIDKFQNSRHSLISLWQKKINIYIHMHEEKSGKICTRFVKNDFDMGFLVWVFSIFVYLYFSNFAYCRCTVSVIIKGCFKCLK